MQGRIYLWDGIVKSPPIPMREDRLERRSVLFSKAKSGHWSDVLALLGDSDSYDLKGHQIIEPNNFSLNTLLHYTALTNASSDIVEYLISRGASRTRRNAQGQRAVDIARERDNILLSQLLEPQLIHLIPDDTIQQIEKHFHTLLKYPPNDPYQFPQIEVLLEGHYQVGYFRIFGLYGGFHYWFDHELPAVTLWVSVESRVVAGSQRSYKITVSGIEEFN
jgi:hypothetical protein